MSAESCALEMLTKLSTILDARAVVWDMESADTADKKAILTGRAEGLREAVSIINAGKAYL